MLEEVTASIAVCVVYCTWMAIANTDHGMYNGVVHLRKSAALPLKGATEAPDF
jgi:hypothetical protein